MFLQKAPATLYVVQQCSVGIKRITYISLGVLISQQYYVICPVFLINNCVLL